MALSTLSTAEERTLFDTSPQEKLTRQQDVIYQKCKIRHSRLETHENPLLKKLLLREENRRLKRNWPIDLM
jgi:hypothetical protein